MNFTGKERYSVPFFFNGNPASIIDTIPGCEKRNDTKNRPFGSPLQQEECVAVQLRDYLFEQYQASYNVKDS